MDDRRIFERTPPAFYSEIICAETGRCLGHLADISLSGMMMVGEVAFVVGERRKLQIEMPRGSGEPRFLAITAIVCWTHPDLEPGTYVTGLEFLLGQAADSDGVARLYRALCMSV